MARKVLIIEDDHDIAELMEYNFTKAGFNTTTLPTANEAVSKILDLKPDIIMLDIMLPGGNGLSILKSIRKTEGIKQTPVIMVTAKGEEEDVTTGLNLGADDYVVKPFSPAELVARIHAVLRRNGGQAEEAPSSPVRIDADAHRVYINNQETNLTASEFKLIQMFKSNNGKVLTRDFLVSGLVGEQTHIIDRNIDVHVRSLRKKLDSYSSYIETVRSIGYRWQE